MCGENLYPRHNIAYHFESERDFFQVFGIYDDKNVCISWDDVEQWCDILGVKHAQVIYRGKYNRDAVVSKFNGFKTRKRDDVEGFVVRNADSFTFNEFAQNVGKYVRANYVLTDENWTAHWTPNEVAKEKETK